MKVLLSKNIRDYYGLEGQGCAEEKTFYARFYQETFAISEEMNLDWYH